MDKYNAFPYVRAALIGQATQSRNPGNRVTRRGSACSQLYKDCPTDSNSLLNYFNNHNGGLVNNVQPSVDSEVAPLIQAIIGNFFPKLLLAPHLFSDLPTALNTYVMYKLKLAVEFKHHVFMNYFGIL